MPSRSDVKEKIYIYIYIGSESGGYCQYLSVWYCDVEIVKVVGSASGEYCEWLGRVRHSPVALGD